MQERKTVTKAFAARYRRARKSEKSRLLDEFVESTGYNRVYAARVLRGHGKRVEVRPGIVLEGSVRAAPRRLGKREYGPDVLKALKKVWKIMDYVCGKRLAPMLPELASENKMPRIPGPMHVLSVMSAEALSTTPAQYPMLTYETSSSRKGRLSGWTPAMVLAVTAADGSHPETPGNPHRPMPTPAVVSMMLLSMVPVVARLGGQFMVIAEISGNRPIPENGWCEILLRRIVASLPWALIAEAAKTWPVSRSGMLVAPTPQGPMPLFLPRSVMPLSTKPGTGSACRGMRLSPVRPRRRLSVRLQSSTNSGVAG